MAIGVLLVPLSIPLVFIGALLVCKPKDFSSRTKDPGWLIQDAGSRTRIQKAGCRMKDPGSRIQDPGSIKDPGSRIQDPRSWVQNPGSKALIEHQTKHKVKGLPEDAT